MRQLPSTYDGSNNPENNVADKPEATSLYEVRDPTRKGANDERNDESFDGHYVLRGAPNADECPAA
jgi:hypothetical protein